MLSSVYNDVLFSKVWYLLGRVRRGGPGYPLQSFFRSSKKDFRYYPSRKLQKRSQLFKWKTVVE